MKRSVPGKSLGYSGEADYQAESDVHHLQSAEEIKNDPKRHARAKSKAKTMLKEHDTKRTQLQNVASGFKQKVKDSSPR